jgi:hypothetical protein
MEKVALKIPSERKIVWMNKLHYQKVYDFILEEVRYYNSLLLHDLIEHASVKLNHQLPANLTWILLQVKQDMEGKGIIKTSLDYLRNQTIMVPSNNKHIIL